jgi:hypothetical protein
MVSEADLRAVLESEALVERLAAAEHERWAHWQKYLHDQCQRMEDGSLVIPAELVARWSAQIATSYTDLSEGERDSDREQVRRYLPIVIEAVMTHTGSQREPDVGT